MGRIFIDLEFMFVEFVEREEEEKKMRLNVDKEKIKLIKQKGKKINLEIEVEEKDEESVSGMMWRKDFKKESEMILIMGEMRRIVMWMKNKKMKIDMVFIDEKGRVVEIKENEVNFYENII